MTRKRFIKLAMAKGASRNEANYAADYVIEIGLTYQQGFELK